MNEEKLPREEVIRMWGILTKSGKELVNRARKINIMLYKQIKELLYVDEDGSLFTRPLVDTPKIIIRALNREDEWGDTLRIVSTMESEYMPVVVNVPECFPDFEGERRQLHHVSRYIDDGSFILPNDVTWQDLRYSMDAALYGDKAIVRSYDTVTQEGMLPITFIISRWGVAKRFYSKFGGGVVTTEPTVGTFMHEDGKYKGQPLFTAVVANPENNPENELQYDYYENVTFPTSQEVVDDVQRISAIIRLHWLKLTAETSERNWEEHFAWFIHASQNKYSAFYYKNFTDISEVLTLEAQ